MNECMGMFVLFLFNFNLTLLRKRRKLKPNLKPPFKKEISTIHERYFYFIVSISRFASARNASGDRNHKMVDKNRRRGRKTTHERYWHGSSIVLLDLSAAFDTIDHDLLLDRLNDHCGLSGPVLSWFSSYLRGRTQAVLLQL